jgi:CRP-like cAMP-binding protein
MARAQSLSRNRLLASLPIEDQRRLLAKVEVFPTTHGQTLHQPGQLPSHAYFPGGGFLSILQMLRDGTMVEVTTIGREGAAGLRALLPPDGRVLGATMVRGESETCYRISAGDLAAEQDRGGALAELMTRYARGATAMALQSTACNGVHLVEHRFARWILAAHDRMETNAFMVSEEYAATILGVQRPAVTLIAGVLQRSGVIDYHGGIVTILNRRRLEAASCECYDVASRITASVFQRDIPWRLGDQREASRDEDHAPPRPHIVARER